jgi:hypothetical protein
MTDIKQLKNYIANKNPNKALNEGRKFTYNLQAEIDGFAKKEEKRVLSKLKGKTIRAELGEPGKSPSAFPGGYEVVEGVVEDVSLDTAQGPSGEPAVMSLKLKGERQWRETKVYGAEIEIL